MALYTPDPSFSAPHAPFPPDQHPLLGYLTTRQAAASLGMSYWHFMHLVEAGRIAGIRVVDRWLFAPAALEAYRRSTRAGETLEMARVALTSPDVALTPRQHDICEGLLSGLRPADIARKYELSRQAVHAHITLIREKVQMLLTHATAKARRVPPSAHPPMASPPYME